MIDLLAELKMKAGELDEAEKLYELAARTIRSTPSGSPASLAFISARNGRPSS